MPSECDLVKDRVVELERQVKALAEVLEHHVRAHISAKGVALKEDPP